MHQSLYPNLAPVALGKKNARLVFRNATVLNVFSEEWIQADIAVEEGYIVGVGQYRGEEEIDCTGKYIVPGFIDAHLHLESTMVTPAEIIHTASLQGTTTFVIDPHEAVNVAGTKGLDYMLDQTEHALGTVYIMLPSCVPATPFEDNGCTFTAALMEEYKNHPRVLGLGEVMDYPAVIGANPAMMEKLGIFPDKTKDGHAPGLSDKELCAYALADIQTDHECISFEYAQKQVRNGMQVHIREGSGARNLNAIVSGIVAKGADTSRFSFCTDDKHVDDILREGHISYNIRQSIALGIPTIKAYKMASINAANCYHLRDKGAIAPGYQADLVILTDADRVDIHSVYCKGLDITNRTMPPAPPCPPELKQTIHMAELSLAKLQHPCAQDTPQSVINILEGQIITKHTKELLPMKNGFFTPTTQFNKLVVVERHKNTGKLATAPVKGFSLCGGALASSVSHDSHNIIAVGDNDCDLLLAMEELQRTQGGYAIAQNGKVTHVLPLPIMGLMTDAGHAQVEATLTAMLQAAHGMGLPEKVDPFVLLSFLALAVIPEIRLLARGLFDVSRFDFIS